MIVTIIMFHGPFLRAVLPMTVETSAQAMVADGKTKVLITPSAR